MENKKYFIAIDSDGTLRRDDGNISEETKKIIQQLKKEGHYLVLCTARPRYHSIEVSKISSMSEFIISSNGSEIYNYKKNETLFSSFLPKESCLQLYHLAKKYEVRIGFSVSNIEYITKYTRVKEQVLLDDSNIHSVLEKNIKQVIMIGNQNTIMEIFNIVSIKYKMNAIPPSEHDEKSTFFIIIADNTSKGHAVIQLSKHFNIPIENVIAIGNDENDISMLEMSGLGVAVENAKESVKKKASLIIPSNNDDGVYQYLKTLSNG